MKLLDCILAELEAKSALRLEDVELSIINDSGSRYYYISYDFNLYGQSMETYHPTREEMFEYLTWVILQEDSRTGTIRNFIQPQCNPDSEQGNAPTVLQQLAADHSQIVKRVRAYPDLTTAAALIIVEMVKSGYKLGYFNRESYENLLFKNEAFVYESGDPIACAPDVVEIYPTQEAFMDFIIQGGWVKYANGILKGRGNPVSYLNHYLQGHAKAESLRIYLEKMEHRTQ